MDVVKEGSYIEFFSLLHVLCTCLVWVLLHADTSVYVSTVHFMVQVEKSPHWHNVDNDEVSGLDCLKETRTVLVKLLKFCQIDPNYQVKATSENVGSSK